MLRVVRYVILTGRRGIAGAFAAAAAVGAWVGFDAVRSGWAALVVMSAAGEEFAAAPSIGDIWYVLLEGCEVFASGSGTTFSLPVSWILSQMLWVVAVASHDLGRRYSVVDRALTRGVSLGAWTAAQCVWSAVAVVAVYAGLLVGSAVGGVIGAAFPDGGSDAGIALSLAVRGFAASRTAAFVAVALASSALMACAQTLLLRVCPPVAALAVSVVYLFAAFLTASPIALGGFSMAFRFFAGCC